MGETVRRFIQALSKFGLYCGLAIAWVGPAYADSNPIITQPTDFWFEYAEETHFIARTFQSNNLESDPQLWLYNDVSGELIISNDDFFGLGLQSNIELDLPAGRYRLRAGTCCWEPDVWRDGVVWNIQYELSFNGIQSNPVTTTTEPEPTTTTSTTTTSTTTSTTTTTTEPATTTTTTQPATTTTLEPTTTTSEVTTSLPAEASTTTTLPELPTTTQLNGTQPSTTSPTTSTTSSTSTTMPTTTSTSPVSTTPESTDGPTTEPITAPTTSVPVTESTIVESLPAEADAEEIVAYLEELTTDDLANLTDTQTEELIASIAEVDLTDEQALQIAEALSDAPTEVKEQFEEEINVFGGQFDTYVPSGSTISVGARRAVVAVTAVAFMLPAPVPTTRRKI